MRTFGAPVDGDPGLPVPPLSDSDQNRLGQQSGGLQIEFGFGSAHPGVFNGVFGDGSTRVIPLGADLNLLENLGARSDGETANAADL